MVEIRELVKYNDRIRRRYFKSLSSLPWGEFIGDKGASWGSIRNVFIHTLGAIDYWLDFLNREELRYKKRLDEFRNFEEVKTYMEHVENRMRNYLDSLSNEKLHKKYTITNDADESVEITAEDVLIHVFEEEIHHRGELIALLWQMNIEPPPMGWKEL